MFGTKSQKNRFFWHLPLSKVARSKVAYIPPALACPQRGSCWTGEVGTQLPEDHQQHLSPVHGLKEVQGGRQPLLRSFCANQPPRQVQVRQQWRKWMFCKKKGHLLGELLRSDPLPGHIHLGSQLPGQVQLAISYLLWKTLAPNRTGSKRSNSDRPSYCSHSEEDRIYFHLFQN